LTSALPVRLNAPDDSAPNPMNIAEIVPTMMDATMKMMTTTAV